MPDLDVDPAVLLDLVEQHALAGRLERQLQAASASPRWRDAVAKQHQDTIALAASHARATLEISARLGREPVLVKGISAALLMNEPHITRCGDIDLICADGAAIVDVVTELGYARTRAPFMHEIGEFTKQGTEIDVHEFYPVHGRGDTVPASGGVQRAPSPFLHRITHERLARTWVRTSSGVQVPDPAFLVIMLCAHAFLNFTNMWSISHRAKPYLKLGEIADVADLTRHSGFDVDRFTELVEECGAHDAVSWAAWALTILIGHNPLPVDVAGEPFARNLWWCFWTTPRVDLASLALPDWFALEDVLPSIGNGLVLDSGSPPWTARAQRQDDEVTVIVTLPRQRANVERGRVDFGSVATEWAIAERLTTVGGHNHVRYEHSDLEHRQLELRYDASRLPRELMIGFAEELDGRLITAALLSLTVED